MPILTDNITKKEFYLHQHNSVDGTSKLKQISFITASLSGVLSQTAGYYGVFFIAVRSCVVKKISEIHTVAGNDAGAVTLQVERLQGTEALDAGDTLLSTAFNLKGTANTLQEGSIITNGRVNGLAIGDRLALKDAGTLTNLQGVAVIVEVEYL